MNSKALEKRLLKSQKAYMHIWLTLSLTIPKWRPKQAKLPQDTPWLQVSFSPLIIGPLLKSKCGSLKKPEAFDPPHSKGLSPSWGKPGPARRSSQGIKVNCSALFLMCLQRRSYQNSSPPS